MHSQNIESASGQQLDLLLVHVPRFQTYYPALNIYLSCNRMAIGLLGLADLAHRKGFVTRILHGGVEHAINKNFSFSQYLKKHKPKYIGFSQHFHQNLVDTLQWASEAKEVLPDSFIFLGGFTSTFFVSEIMDSAPFVDAVCKGDAEIPLVEMLTSNVQQNQEKLREIPNLVWRNNGEIVENEQSYIVDEKIINELNFTNFNMFEHAEVYIDIPKAPMRTNIPGGFDRKLNLLLGRDKNKVYWGLPVGRGCVYNCSYCGGGGKAQLLINKRKGVVFRTHENVINSIKDLINFGFKGSYVSFDPTPPLSEEYYSRLFQMMREQGLQFNILFSAWRLPTNKFIEEFAKTAGPQSAILISPEMGSEEKRKLTRPNSYSNAELFETLEYADQLGVRTNIYFSFGAMEKSIADIEETIELQKEIKKRITNASIEAFLIETEPGSSWHMNPEKYDINLHRQSFDEFLFDHCSAQYSSMTNLGYTTEMFGDKDMDVEEFNKKMLKIRCRKFCNMRLKCILMRGIWAVGRAVGLVPTPKKLTINGLK